MLKEQNKMKLLFLTIVLSFLCVGSSLDTSRNYNVVCFLDAACQNSRGLSPYLLKDLEYGIEYCTHLVYNYASIEAETFKVRDVEWNILYELTDVKLVTNLKEKYPHIKFLLSIGSELDQANSEKYIQLLEAGREKQKNFIDSVKILLEKYSFDGLDLSFPLPRNKPRTVHSNAGLVWKNIKQFFAGQSVVDNKAEEHRQQITNLIKDIRTAFKPDDLMLTLTVLPNVNSSWYFDAPAIMDHLDFVNLAAFDFVTPNRNPEEADYASSLYENPAQNRYPYNNVNFQVEHWLKQRVAANKINLGISTYGRGWNMTTESGNSGLPVVSKTNGPARYQMRAYEYGKINYEFICMRLLSPENPSEGFDSYANPVADPTNRFGVYVFRPADKNNQDGIWVSYESPETAGIKAQYAKQKNLGGIALFDLTNDDFFGWCKKKYPILQSIRNKLYE